VSGHVEFNGVLAQPTADQLKKTIVFVDMPGSDNGGGPFGFFQTWRGVLSETGSFQSAQVPPGRYFVRLASTLPGWTLDSITANGRDITDVALEIAAADINDVVIRFVDKSSTLSGIVRTPQRQPDARAAVIVFPVNQSQWVDYPPSPRRLKIARASPTGAYSIAALPAGDYFVAAVDDGDAGAWLDPKFLAKVSGQATRVTIERGQSKTQELTTVTVK